MRNQFTSIVLFSLYASVAGCSGDDPSGKNESVSGSAGTAVSEEAGSSSGKSRGGSGSSGKSSTSEGGGMTGEAGSSELAGGGNDSVDGGRSSVAGEPGKGGAASVGGRTGKGSGGTTATGGVHAGGRTTIESGGEAGDGGVTGVGGKVIADGGRSVAGESGVAGFEDLGVGGSTERICAEEGESCEDINCCDGSADSDGNYLVCSAEEAHCVFDTGILPGIGGTTSIGGSSGVGGVDLGHGGTFTGVGGALSGIGGRYHVSYGGSGTGGDVGAGGMTATGGATAIGGATSVGGSNAGGTTSEPLVCTSPQANCNSDEADGCEVDLSADLANCGACGEACEDLPGTIDACDAGDCTFTCVGGFGDCNEDPEDGCEIALDVSTHCGACNNACNSGTETCQDYACTSITCGPEEGNCDSNSVNGCETNLTTISDCGGCGIECATLAHMTASCDGECLYVCGTGFADCNGTIDDGCEVDLKTDTNHCGACTGAVCPSEGGTPSCSNGTCSITCESPYLNCDGLVANGCETNTASDVSNCLGCGLTCSNPAHSAGATCSASGCQIGTCVEGWSNCNGNSTDGCESNEQTDESNCGICGNACIEGAVCMNGECSIQELVTTFGAVVDFDVKDNTLVFSTSSDAGEACFSYLAPTATHELYSKELDTGLFTDLDEEERVHGLTIKPEGIYGISNHGDGSIMHISNGGEKFHVGTGNPWHLAFDDDYVYWSEREIGTDVRPTVSIDHSIVFQAPRSFNGTSYNERYHWGTDYKLTFLIPNFTGGGFMVFTNWNYLDAPYSTIHDVATGTMRTGLNQISFGSSPCVQKEIMVGEGSDVYHVGTFSSVYAIRKNHSVLATLDPALVGRVTALTADSSFVYYATDTYNIWKVSTDGGTPTLLTTNDGFSSKLRADGNYLYYTLGDSIRRMLVQ